MFVSWFKYKKALEERDKLENECIDLLRVFNTYNREKERFSNHNSKEAKWIEKYTDIICPVCESVFSDEIYYMCRNRNRSESMLFCPNCGEKMGETKKNLYEKIKKMSVDEMAECISMIVYGSIYASRGIPHLATPENIKSDSNYEMALVKAKEMLLEEQNG